MNEALYEAVFCYTDKKVDPFARSYVDFDRIIADMKLVGYEINSFNIAHQIVLEELDYLIKKKGQIMELAMDMDNRDEFCRQKYGLSFKDIDALDPAHDFEFDIKSGQVIFYLVHEAQHKEQEYLILFQKELEQFINRTGFSFVSA
ncbi:MAG: hypothetical protein K6E91_06305 [Butyrivibrio sp.]|nr:hypothetical protein [Butyrivibrio sp.]